MTRLPDPRAAVLNLATRVAPWPPVVRDVGAASLALWALFLGEVVVTVVPGRPEVLLALPGAVLAFLVFGAGSALFGLLVAALVVHATAGERAQQLFSFGAGEMSASALLAVAFAILYAALRARLRHRAQLASSADVVLHQVKEAHERLARAEAEAATARAALLAAEAELRRRHPINRKAPRENDLEVARRQEGGI